MKWRTIIIPVFGGLAFLGAMIWAKSADPFVRKWFTVKTPHVKVACVAVLPKPDQPRPVVVYLHGSGGNLISDGKELRRLAELGLAAVSVEYNQTNYAAFEEDFPAVLDYVRHQPWAAGAFCSNSPSATQNPQLPRVAWLGFSQGAQNQLRFLLRHPEMRPQLLVRLSGGWVGELGPILAANSSPNLKTNSDDASRNIAALSNTTVLLVHGEADEIFPVNDTRKLAALLATNGVATDLKILPGTRHGIEPNRAQVSRAIGEYIKAHLTPEHPQPEFTKPSPIPFLVCEIPAFLWLGFWFVRWKRAQPQLPKLPLTKWDIGLRIVATVLAIWASAETAIHLVTPRMQVTPRTLEIARQKLLAPKWHDDFEALAQQSIWNGQKLETLLTHVELSHYCVYELINWKLPPDIYRDYVLSPVIEGDELNWRRPLWEFYYPRIRKENTTESAATIVARTLRERITVWPGFDRPQGIETIWRDQITGEKGFELIYVATLRSVGVPARLNSSHKAEFWDGTQWRSAPRPLLDYENSPLALAPNDKRTAPAQ